MILSDKRIMEEMEKGTIKIQPYNRKSLGSNSYDVHLGPVWPLTGNIFWMQKNIMKLNLSKSPKKDSFCTRIFFTWA